MNNHRIRRSSLSSLRKRKRTLKKKAEELSILCGVPVALICVEPATTGNKVDTWPADPEKIDEILKQYQSKTNNASDETTAFLFPIVKNRNPNSGGEEKKKKKKMKLMYEKWNTDLDYLPEESLIEILGYIEEKEKILDRRKNL